ncbi:unnamed protein product, partial [Ixodes pacificus]
MSENLRSSGYHCVVFRCSNNFTKRKQNRGKWCDEHEKLQRECGCNVFVLHAFPTEPDLRRQWTASINREGFVPNSSSRVCSDHFIDGKRTECNPVPMLRLGYHRKVIVGRRRLDRVYVPPLKMQKLNQNAPQLSSSCFQGGKKPLASIATNVGPQSPTALRTTWLSSTQSLARSASTNVGPQSPTVTIGGNTGRLPNMSPARSPCATIARPQTPTVALTPLRRVSPASTPAANGPRTPTVTVGGRTPTLSSTQSLACTPATDKTHSPTFTTGGGMSSTPTECTPAPKGGPQMTTFTIVGGTGRLPSTFPVRTPATKVGPQLTTSTIMGGTSGLSSTSPASPSATSVGPQTPTVAGVAPLPR